MARRFLHFVCSLLVAAGLAAQGNIVPAGPSVARAADADRSGDVSAEEWRAFLAGLGAADDGALDRMVVKAAVLVPTLDRDNDGNLTGKDVRALFDALDRDNDGVVTQQEMGARRAGGLVLAVVVSRADGDGNGEVTTEEWQAFVEPFAPDQSVPRDTVVAWVRAAEDDIPEDRSAFSAATYLVTLGAGLDDDNNGTVEVSDLEQLFADLDRNADGALASAEMRGQRGRPGNGNGGRSWRAPTAEDRSSPTLMPWQRTLEDALAVQRKTGKPLLICVNVDGEPASESLAYTRYRDPEFVALAAGFVPMVASPDRHTTLDHDGRGRRIVDPKFGRVTSGEHIDIEPGLFERYFGGQRVAPRHVGVDPQGKILFDIYLTNDHGSIDDALRQHGNHGTPIPAAETLDLAALLDSSYVMHRERLEALFAAGDESTRSRIAGAALAADRDAQHVEILRRALVDPGERVRLEAAGAMARHSAAAPLDLYPAAFRACYGRPARCAALVDGLQAKAIAETDAATLQRTRVLERTFASLQLESRLIDVAAWRAAIDLAPGAVEAALTEEELPALDRHLDELEQQRRDRPEDREVNLLLAAVTMRYARIRMQHGSDPTFLLHDVIAAAERATSPAKPDGRALGYLAWANYLLDQQDDAVRYAAAALPHLADEAGTPLAFEVLNVFVRGRSAAVYDAIQREREWPASWIADTAAAHRILIDHPASTEEQFTAFLDFSSALQVWGPQPEVLRKGLARFPASAKLHEYLRLITLADYGAQALEDAYAAMESPPGFEAHINWFAGLASLVAAERHAEELAPEAAIAAYRRSVERFEWSIRDAESFGPSASHYICLALAGRARLHADAGAWDEAIAAIEAAFAANPEAVRTKDGLGQTPREHADAIRSALDVVGRKSDAERVRNLLR